MTCSRLLSNATGSDIASVDQSVNSKSLFSGVGPVGFDGFAVSDSELLPMLTIKDTTQKYGCLRENAYNLLAYY